MAEVVAASGRELRSEGVQPCENRSKRWRRVLGATAGGRGFEVAQGGEDLLLRLGHAGVLARAEGEAKPVLRNQN